MGLPKFKRKRKKWGNTYQNITSSTKIIKLKIPFQGPQIRFNH